MQEKMATPYKSEKRKIHDDALSPVPRKNLIFLEDGLLAGDIILLWRIQFGTFTNQTVFPKYFEYTYGINAPKHLETLIEKEYVIEESAFMSLDHIRGEEKKKILKEKGVKGLSKLKVKDLDTLLAQNFSELELSKYFSIRGYKLTSKGKKALESNQAVVDKHPKKNI
ncbi:hypothetical protein HCQ94_02925 [Actinomyces sp. zg-332]|uniref:hypothetical protein n=1 Tax=Actinomyces sp. zg-332 TaxID=2708340 RepID=UPI00141E8E60|nr:hypothetical protein [Actinomyces sp. zg-332]QPK94669.1 hypothetical protein HCQ94_02925 [Actinomyces sp. zg-332]